MKYYYIFAIVFFIFIVGIPNVFAASSDTVKNHLFTMKIPKNWAYIEGSTSDYVWLTPDKFSDILSLSYNAEQIEEKIKDGSPGLAAVFAKDTYYAVKGAPLESYVKNAIVKIGIQNILSQHYTTVGKEKAVRIETNESAYSGNKTKLALFFVLHDNQPYAITYLADPKSYEKYLPEFEKIVKNFRFVDSPPNESDEKSTNAKTNFSGVNLTDYEVTSNGNPPEGSYEECVGVAGKSLCDFLFKR